MSFLQLIVPGINTLVNFYVFGYGHFQVYEDSSSSFALEDVTPVKFF